MRTRRSFGIVFLALLAISCGGGDTTGPENNENPNGNGNGNGAARVTTITINPSSVQLQQGERSTLSATVLDQNGAPLNRAVSWQSSNTATAVVSSTGEVVAISPGDVAISATLDGKQGFAIVTVRALPTTATVVVTNQLIYPVLITIGGQVQGTVPAESTRQVSDIPAGATTVNWELVRPLLGSTPLGEAMSGVFSVSLTAGSTRTFTVDNHVGTTTYFAPLVTNLTSVPLLMVVNYGLQSEMRCNCTAPAGTQRVHMGYYRLFSNSNMTVFRSGSGYTGSYRYFDTFASSVTSGSGIREFSFSTAP